MNSLVFTAGSDLFFFATKRVRKGYSRLKNQSAGIDAGGSACFFFVSEDPTKNAAEAGKLAEPGVTSNQRFLNSSNTLFHTSPKQKLSNKMDEDVNDTFH